MKKTDELIENGKAKLEKRLKPKADSATNGKIGLKSKSGASLAEGTDFEQFYAGRIRLKINKFTQQHESHNIANVSMELLFVDIYSLMEKEGLIEQKKVAIYTKPEMMEKTREVKVRREKESFFSKLLGLAPKIYTEIVSERYMDEGPSEFKKDIKTAIVFYHFARVEHADFNLEDIVKYTLSSSLKKLGYYEYAEDILQDIDANALKHYEDLQVTFNNNREEIEKGFEEVIVDSRG